MTREKNFLLNEKIYNDSNLICELPLCKFLLMNDSNYPWFILVPRRSNIVEFFDLSKVITFKNWDKLTKIRKNDIIEDQHEGLMIKKIDGSYIPGRPKGYWYKWKKDPKNVDAVLMYAIRGHGKRSSYYSDFTFGLWDGNQLSPIGKAYFGFDDNELKVLDKFVRNNTINKFGPVREVEKTFVIEIAFDAVNESNRHKSFCNKVEAKFIVKHLENLLNSGCDVMALTPYKGQVMEIRSHLPKKFHQYVRTVDGFQGKEADFILFSLVRSNKRTGSSRRWGSVSYTHLTLPTKA